MPKLTRSYSGLMVWDALILIPVGVLLLLGFTGLFSTSLAAPFFSSTFFRQLIWLVLSLGLVWLLKLISPRVYMDQAYRLYALMIVLLLLTYFMPAVSGGRRWLVIGGIGLQPSEFGKIIVVLALAKFLAENQPKLERFHFALLPLAIAGGPALLIIGQPDLGTAIIFMTTAFAMMYWAGVAPMHLFVMAAPVISLLAGFNFYTFSIWMLLLVLVLYFSRSKLRWSVINFVVNASFGTLAPTLWNKLQPYQQRRILTMLDATSDPQGAGYQVLQSRTAIGSGGFFGKGLGEGTQTHLRFLPVTDTDFIIAVIGEEFGFIAILLALILYGWLLLRMIDRAATTQYRSASLTIVGFATILLVHVFVNMGMATGLMPVTGLPLPFMSYGGSFLLTCLLMIGMTHYIIAVEP